MAASVRRLNHVAFQIARGDRLPSTLTDRFKFDLFASRMTDSVRQLAFRKGAAVFLVNELQRAVPPVSDGTENLPDLLYDAPVPHAVNTACNACFEVDNVEGSCKRLQENGCHVLVPPLEVEDQRGKVVYCVVKSIVGNVRHTLLDRTRYTGDFLPGFQSISSEETKKEDSAGTFFDHITYASPRKSTGQVLRWYEKNFDFKRFLINRHDSADDGFVINGDGMGLRLTAMQYWQCSKVSLTLPSVEKDEPDCKFVVAESLPEQGKNQVDTFLEHHQGAGIQHIALYTNDILCTSRILMESGVQFVSPPPTYYSQFEKAQEIQTAGYDPRLLSKFGILLDTEEEHAKNVFHVGSQNVKDTQRPLLQIFTKPIFPENTFLLELIQRRGASGFGEGNIRALWRSVQAYMDSRELAEHSR